MVSEASGILQQIWSATNKKIMECWSDGVVEWWSGGVME
jgi:hypothetical protein